MGEGGTRTLTANADGANAVSPAVNTDGTAGNDTYNAVDTTLNSADTIDGKGGIDTLSVRATAAATAAPQLTSIENVNVSNVSNALYTLNLASASGVQTVSSVNQNANATTEFTNIAATGVAGRLDNADGRTDLNFQGAAARTGTADEVSLQVANGSGTSATAAVLNITDGAGGAAVADATFENFNIATSGAASVVNMALGGANARVINVTGDGAGLTLTEAANFAAVRTVDASAMSAGGLDVNLSGNNQNVTFTGSAQNDAVRMGGSLTTADVLNGGEGTDTIGITNGANLVTGLQVTGFETLDVGGANATGAAALANAYDLSKLAGITTLKVGSAINADAGANDVVTINNLAKGAGVEINGTLGTATGDGLVINVKDAGAGSPNDTIDVTLSGRAGITTAGDLTINDIETVNLSSTSTGTSQTHTLSNLTASQATSVKVDASSAGLTITDLDALALVSFDASASTKAVSLTTGTDAFSATGGTAFVLGQGNDTIVLTGATSASTGTDFVITGGKGGDAITLSAAGQVEVLKYAAGDSQVGVTSGSNNFDTVATFTDGEDKIDLTSFELSGNAIASLKSNAATTINATTGEVNAASQTNFFGAGSDQRGVAIVDVAADGGVPTASDVWVYVDANKDGSFQADTDLAIKLTGLLDADNPTLADFTFA